MLQRSIGLVSAFVAILSTSTVFAEDAVPKPDLGPLLQGQLVFHGNYCGPGNKGRHPAPVDALDEACMHHDACVTDFEIPSCACNARLAEAAAAVAADPQAPADEREAADFTARGAQALPCQ